MSKLILQRLYLEKFKKVQTINGTLGLLYLNETNPDSSICFTLELPWKDNKPSVSCIPEGEYKIQPYTSEKYKGVYQVMNVLNRSNILIHTGNYLSDIQGCIMTGTDWDNIKDAKGNKKDLKLTESKKAFEILKKTIEQYKISDLLITYLTE